jgi:hypothetical protein
MPLVVTRRKRERVQIGDDIVIEVTDIRGSREVKLAFFEPKSVVISRLSEGAPPERYECKAVTVCPFGRPELPDVTRCANCTCHQADEPDSIP